MLRQTSRISAVLGLLLMTSAAFAQQARPSTQPYGDRLDVNMVLIDAVVTDSDGNQILGLDKSDFIVRERGVEQTIETVDYVTSRRLLDAREGNAPFNIERIREERYIVFFFDKPEPGSGMTDVIRARTSVKRFLREEMTDTDRVAIVGHDVRLKVYSDFTNDRKQLERAADEMVRFGQGLLKNSAGSAGTGASILRNVDASDMMSGSGTVYEAVEVLADALRPLRARKNLVLFSPGIIGPGEEVRNGMITTPSRYLAPAIAALNNANVTVYGINTQMEAAGSVPAIHYSLERLSNETNGRYFRNNTSFDRPLEQIDTWTSGYYLLAYRPKSKAAGFQKVDVSLRRPELRVKARAGYTAQ
jgi:VWFA-related protein